METESIVKRSPFFKAALAHDFKEALERKVRLPDCSPDTFARYLEYRKYVGLDGFDGVYGKNNVKLYILADYLRDIRVCNDLIDTFFLGLGDDDVPESEVVTLIYESTSSTSPLRCFLLDRFLEDIESSGSQRFPSSQGGWIWVSADDSLRQKWLEDAKDSLPFEFIFDVACARLSPPGTKRPNAEERGQGYYHQHDTQAPKAECCECSRSE